MQRNPWPWLFAVFAACVIVSPFARGTFVSKAPIGGFAAFYCAGRAVVTHHDPYRVEPLRSCERRLVQLGAALPEPAPLPPFALLAFTGLSLLPFGAAIALFTSLLIAATVLAVWALRRLTGFTWVFLGAALLVTDLYHNLLFGEIPPIVVGCLCWAALLVERKRFIGASVVAAATLIEPHVAAPALLAMFIALPRVRLPLAAIGAALAALSYVSFGLSGTLEYFTAVLPAHALSEVPANDQYSVTWIAHQLGSNDVVAARVGMLSYLIACGIGIAAALRLRAAYERAAFIVLVPSAFAVIGGSFVHDLQLVVALPAAILLMRVVEPQRRRVALLSIVGLAAPWSTLVTVGLPSIGVLVWTSVVGQSLTQRARVRFTAAVCAAYVLGVAALLALPDAVHGNFPANVPLPADPHELASTAWSNFVHVSAYGQASLRTVVRKIPLWASLLLFAICAVGAGSRKPRTVDRFVTAHAEMPPTPIAG